MTSPVLLRYSRYAPADSAPTGTYRTHLYDRSGCQNPFEIATVAPSSVGILVADVNGRIYILDKSFEPIRTWVVHVAGRVTHMMEKKGILVTLGVRPDYTVSPPYVLI